MINNSLICIIYDIMNSPKVYLTKSTFFMQTERHTQRVKIATHFTALLVEEARSANSSTDEIASHLSTDLSPSA